MDAQTIRLLPAGSGDLRWVEAFALIEYPLAYAYLWRDGGAAYVSEAFSAQALDAELRESGSRLDLVEFEGERVGFCRVVAGKAPPRNSRFERYHYLHRIYLAHPQVRPEQAGMVTMERATRR